MPQLNTTLTDYSPLAEDSNVSKLAMNGVLVNEKRTRIIRQTKYEIQGQQLRDLESPTEVLISFDIIEVEDDDELAIIDTFQAVGSPGQAYNYAVARFMPAD